MKRETTFTLSQDEYIENLAQALSSPIRRKIFGLLREEPYTINEIAEKLDIPLSTASFHVSLLSKAGLVNVLLKPGAHGSAKLISRKWDVITLVLDDIEPNENKNLETRRLEVELGSFSDIKMSNICGIVDAEKIIGVEDMPSAFYLPERRDAQLLWFSHGYVEYRIPNYYLYSHNVKSLFYSFEVCSEAPNFNMDWPSDITTWINGIEVCTFTIPSDYGDRRGVLTPKWWSDFATQYGLLKNIRIDQNGVYINDIKDNNLSIDKLGIDSGQYFTLRIGVKDDAVNKGGMNLFGKCFGDHPQDIIVKVDYEL